MKQIKGVWLTDGEEHLVPFLDKGEGTYQLTTLDRAVKKVRSRGLVIDIGAHVGLWSMHLAKQFERVVGFEPVPVHRECFALNVPDKNVTLHPFALGEEEKTVTLDWNPANTGHTHVGQGTLSVPMKRLDAMNLKNVDLIKIDCEGYEVFVLRGAKELLLRDKPIICIEQKPHGYYNLEQLAGVRYLESLGATVIDRVRDDYIMGWPGHFVEEKPAAPAPVKVEKPAPYVAPPEPPPSLRRRIKHLYDNVRIKMGLKRKKVA
jgi:FkbM family methyltransferase